MVGSGAGDKGVSAAVGLKSGQSNRKSVASSIFDVGRSMFDVQSKFG